MVKTNDPTTVEGVQAIKAAFEYTVDAVGEYVDAGPLWLDYVAFSPRWIRSTRARRVKRRAAALERRGARAYRRALAAGDAVDALYREYDAFESKLDKTLAKALLAEVKPKTDLVRAILKERKTLRDALVVGGLAGKPGANTPSKPPAVGAAAQQQAAQQQKTPEAQASLWRALLDWERTNPQNFPAAEDGSGAPHPQLTRRVALTFELALMSLRRFPDVWLEFAAWHEGEGRVEDALATLDRAAEAIPSCSMFAFYASDLLELRGDAAGAKARYEAVLDAHERDAEARAARAAADGTCATERDFEHAPMADATCLAYVEYLRCCRRCEGSASSRKAFMRARRAPGAKARWEIFVAAALVEWRYDRAEKPARNVFELGLKTHFSNPRYVEAYAEFLVGANDAANARVLFERAATDALDALRDADAEALGETRDDPERRARKERAAATIRDVFDQFVAFEHEHGTMETMRAVESRRAEALDRASAGPGGRGRKSKSECRSARLAEAARGEALFLPSARRRTRTRFARLGARMPRGWGASTAGGGQQTRSTAAAAEKPSAEAPGTGAAAGNRNWAKGGEKTAGLPPPSPRRPAPGAKGTIPKKDAVTLKPAPKQQTSSAGGPRRSLGVVREPSE